MDELAGTFDPASFDPDATELIGFFRVIGSYGDLGYIKLSVPNPGSAGPDTWFVWWGDVDTELHTDTAAGP